LQDFDNDDLGSGGRNPGGNGLEMKAKRIISTESEETRERYTDQQTSTAGGYATFVREGTNEAGNKKNLKEVEYDIAHFQTTSAQTRATPWRKEKNKPDTEDRKTLYLDDILDDVPEEGDDDIGMKREGGHRAEVKDFLHRDSGFHQKGFHSEGFHQAPEAALGEGSIALEESLLLSDIANKKAQNEDITAKESIHMERGMSGVRKHDIGVVAKKHDNENGNNETEGETGGEETDKDTNGEGGESGGELTPHDRETWASEMDDMFYEENPDIILAKAMNLLATPARRWALVRHALTGVKEIRPEMLTKRTSSIAAVSRSMKSLAAAKSNASHGEKANGEGLDTTNGSCHAEEKSSWSGGTSGGSGMTGGSGLTPQMTAQSSSKQSNSKRADPRNARIREEDRITSWESVRLKKLAREEQEQADREEKMRKSIMKSNSQHEQARLEDARDATSYGKLSSAATTLKSSGVDRTSGSMKRATMKIAESTGSAIRRLTRNRSEKPTTPIAIAQQGFTLFGGIPLGLSNAKRAILLEIFGFNTAVKLTKIPLMFAPAFGLVNYGFFGEDIDQI